MKFSQTHDPAEARATTVGPKRKPQVVYLVPGCGKSVKDLLPVGQLSLYRKGETSRLQIRQWCHRIEKGGGKVLMVVQGRDETRRGGAISSL